MVEYNRVNPVQQVVAQSNLTRGPSTATTGQAFMKQDQDGEIIVMVAALEAYDCSRSETQNTSNSLVVSSTNGNSTFEPEPVRSIANSGPPKRFRRRGVIWESITRRLLLLAQGHSR